MKPGFFKNEDLGALPPLTRILFEGLWCMADRAGRLEDRPTRIKVEILPYDECNVDEMLTTLAESQERFILRYTAPDGKRYIQVENFDKHQNPHHREAPSTIPAPGQPQASPGLSPDKPGTSPELAVLIPDSLIPDSLIPDSLIPDSLIPKEEAARGRATPPSPLLEMAMRELPKSESKEEDYRRTIERHQARLADIRIEQIICELAEWKDAKSKTRLHLTLNKWLAKEQPAPVATPEPAYDERAGRIEGAVDRFFKWGQEMAQGHCHTDEEWQEAAARIREIKAEEKRRKEEMERLQATLAEIRSEQAMGGARV